MKDEAVQFTREDFEDFISNRVWSRVRQLVRDYMEEAVSVLNDDKKDAQRFEARADIRAGNYLLSVTSVIEQEIPKEEKHG